MMFNAAAPAGAVLAMLPFLVIPTAAGPLASPKRGLVFTPNSSFPMDNYIWVQHPSDLTWYYNYLPIPSPVFQNISQSDFEFVPMLWGKPADLGDTTFSETIKQLIDEKGVNITNVLSFNEPDAPSHWGGSNINPDDAARVWINNIAPLRERGIRVGLPACTGAPTGLPWLQQFLESCSKIISNGGPRRNCTYDFVTLHWYGPFEGLASHIGEYSSAFPNKTMWITEYNFNDQDLDATQSFYNTSAEYLDRLNYVEQYSLFSAFRSDVSNVGPNAAMLSSTGKLTDIGAWYLGRKATGVLPTSNSLTSVIPHLVGMFLGSLFAAAAPLNF